MYIHFYSVPCGDLQSLITPLCPLDELQAARFTRHITEGLQYLHNLSIIHVNIAVSYTETEISS